MDQFPDRFVREAERREITGVSRSTWWRWETEGQVPRRRILGPNAKGWLLSELLEWQRSRPVTNEPA